MATEYNHLIESNENFSRNPNYMNNFNTKKIYNNQNINMEVENNNKILEDDFNQNQNSPNQNMISSGFNPYLRPPQSLRWRNIMKIDLDIIRNSRDLSLLNSNLENLIYSDITEEDIQSVPEENVIKLIQILQFLNEFLLEQRQMINNRLISLQQEGKKLSKDQQDLDKILLKQKDILNKSKKDAKERLKEITDYKNAIAALLKEGKNLKGKNIKITDINMDINKNMKTYGHNNNYNNYNNDLKEGYKCKYCIGIVFPSEFELKKHYGEIHQITQFNDEPQIIKAQPNKSQVTIPIEVNIPNLNDNINNNTNGQLEKEINNLRFEFKDYMNQIEKNKLESQLLSQKSQNDNRDNYKEQIERMGNLFNDTLKQALGSMVNNQQEKPKIIKRKKKEKNPKLDEEINYLKGEIAKAKLLNQDYDNKIINKKKEINLLIIKKQEMTTISQNQFKPKKTQLVPTQNMQMLFSKSNIGIKRRANKFHSGDLISDHDDTDNENKKKEKMQKKIIAKIDEGTEIIRRLIPKKVIIPQPEILRAPIIDMDQGEKLDDFYKRYKKRDNNFIISTKFSNYKRVLPIDFNEDDNVNDNARTRLRSDIKTRASFFSSQIKDYKIPDFIDVKDLMELDKNDLKETIGTLLTNMDNLNNEGDELRHFDSMRRLLNLNKLKKYIKDEE